jgi:hypothetical protein
MKRAEAVTLTRRHLVAGAAARRLRLERRSVSTSSELLLSEARGRIESAFGVAPFNLYGIAEGLWGCDCSEPPACTCSRGRAPPRRTREVGSYVGGRLPSLLIGFGTQRSALLKSDIEWILPGF